MRILKALTDWKNWVIFLVLWFFTGGWFLYVLGWIFNIPELHIAATAYVTLIGIANPFIPVIPITIGLTLGLRKLLMKLRERSIKTKKEINMKVEEPTKKR